MKHVVEGGTLEECLSGRKSERGKDNRMRKLTEGDGGS